MSVTLTPSRFGMSHSGAQQSYGADTTSMVDTLPVIDFNFSDLHERMRQFTVRFDEFIERGRKRVLEERNAFRMTIADQAEQQRQKKQAITELESKTSSHAHIIAKEAQETDEMHEAIRSLTLQKEEHLTRRDQLKAEIASVQSAIKQRREAQAAHQRSLDAQARHNGPELRFWELCLGMRFEASGVDDRIKVVFVALDERDAERECWFELNYSGMYEVTSTKPRLNRDDVDAAQDKLNESGEMGEFYKTMRGMFVEVVKS